MRIEQIEIVTESEALPMSEFFDAVEQEALKALREEEVLQHHEDTSK